MTKALPSDLAFNVGQASSWDPETREFTAVIVSGPGVVATSSMGDRVMFDAAGLDDSGIRGGTVPLLHEHFRDMQLGKVLSLSVGEGRATVRVRLDPPDTHRVDSPEAIELQALEKRLAAGTQTGFSMRVTDMVPSGSQTNFGEESPIRIATARITEVSSTSMPGDPGATALSAPDSAIVDGDSSTSAMSGKDNAKPEVQDVALSAPETTQPDTTQPEATPTDISLSAAQMDELADRIHDRQSRRQKRLHAEVDTVVKEYALTAEQRQELLLSGNTGVELYKAAHGMDRLNREASLGSPVATQTSGAGRNNNRSVEVREAAFSVLESRLNGTQIDKEASKLFHPWDIPSLLDLSQGLALSNGAANGLGRGGVNEMAFNALVRDELPDLMRELVNKRLQTPMPGRPPVYSRLSVRRPVRDFSQILTTGSSRLKLTVTEESAEIRNTQLKEEGNTYRAKLADTKLTMSYEVVVGDDIGWIQNLANQAPISVNNSLEEMFVESFTSGSAQFDGSALFSTTRGNQQTGALTKNNLSGAVSKLQTIEDLTGEPSNLTARYLLVPSELEGMALDTLNKRQGERNVVVDASDTSPYSGQIDVIATPWLSNSNVAGNSDKTWYLFADPMQMRSIEHAVLEREPGPYFSTRMEMDRSLTFYLANTGAFAVANPRGIIKGVGS